MKYVDGYILPGPKKNLAVFRKMMDPKAMPFDSKRMVYGGFKLMVDA